MTKQQPVLMISSAQKSERGCKLVNGTRLYYEIKGEGPPLVFIHEFTLDHRMWDDQFYFFSKWYRCIRYDVRGYGQSALPDAEPVSAQDDLKTLLVTLNITEPVTLIGHSMGGDIALNFALQYPRFTRALILANTQIEGYNYKEFRLEAIFNSAQKKGIEYAKRKWIAHDLFTSAKKNKLVASCLIQMIDFYSGWHLVSGQPLIATQPGAWEQLEHVTCPTLILTGEWVLPDFREISETASRRIPGAEKITLAKTGHMINMENPVSFNKLVHEFVNREASIMSREW